MLTAIVQHYHDTVKHASQPVVMVCQHTPKLVRETVVELRRMEIPVIEHQRDTLLSMVCDGELLNLKSPDYRTMPIVIIVEPVITMSEEDVVALRILAYLQRLFPGRVAMVLMLQRGDHLSISRVLSQWVNVTVIPIDVVELTPIVTMSPQQLPEIQKTAAELGMAMLYLGQHTIPDAHQVSGYKYVNRILDAKAVRCSYSMLHQTAVSRKKYVVVCDSMEHLWQWSMLSSYSEAEHIIVLSQVRHLEVALPLPTPSKLWAMVCEPLHILTQLIVQGDYNKTDYYQLQRFQEAIQAYGKWQSVRSSYLYYWCTHEDVKQYKTNPHARSLLRATPRHLTLTMKMMITAVMVTMERNHDDITKVTQWRQRCMNIFDHHYTDVFMQCYGEPVLCRGWVKESLELPDAMWQSAATQVYQYLQQAIRTLQ